MGIQGIWSVATSHSVPYKCSESLACISSRTSDCSQWALDFAWVKCLPQIVFIIFMDRISTSSIAERFPLWRPQDLISALCRWWCSVGFTRWWLPAQTGAAHSWVWSDGNAAWLLITSFLPVEVQSLAAGMGLVFTQLCHDSVLLASLALGCCLCRCLKELKNAVKCGCFCPGCSFPFTIVLLCAIKIKAMSLCISTPQNLFSCSTPLFST